MSKILVPLDGSPLAEQALPYALATFAPGDELVLFRVVDIVKSYSVEYPFLFTDLQDALEKEAVADLERLEKTLAVPVKTLVAFGGAVDEIVHAAQAENVSRIVLSSRGRTGFSRWLMGSVAENVCRRATCPVWLIPACRDPKPAQVERILIALDGSEESDAAVDYAKRFPGGPKRALLMTATDLLPGSPSPKIARARQEIVECLAASLELRANELRKEGWIVDCEVVDSFASSAILDTAEKRGSDMILMTTHGRSGWKRFVSGSVAEMVARHSPCPVILINPHAHVAKALEVA